MFLISFNMKIIKSVHRKCHLDKTENINSNSQFQIRGKWKSKIKRGSHELYQKEVKLLLGRWRLKKKKNTASIKRHISTNTFQFTYNASTIKE